MGFQQLFPLTDSIWVCFTVLVLVLFIPMLSKRIRVPQIAGLIITGLVVGPGLLGVIESTPAIDFFSRIGLLFIMFFAGLEISLEELKRNRLWGFISGLLTFAVPFAACYICCTALLGLSSMAAVTAGCIMGSHTLVSYPIISRYALSRRNSVTVSVSGALFAILLALSIYAVSQSSAADGLSSALWLALRTAIYLGAVIVLFPRLARSFFNNVKNSFSHFLFVMILLALGCGLADVIGLDGILGAFLTGIVLNRYIPKSSPLMNRLDFTGNTLFVPVFLLQTGMLIDLKGMIGEWNVLLIFAVLFAAGTAGKWLVALFVQKACRMVADDRRIMFGLSSAHAAGALAIAMGAYGKGLIDNSMLSAIILIVLFSCILSSVVTEKSAARLHASQSEADAPQSRLMVMLTGSNTLQALMDTAVTVYRRNGNEMAGIYITIKGEHATAYMQEGKSRLSEAEAIAASADIPFISQNRMGNNIVDSILHAAGEYGANSMIMGLPPRTEITTGYFENMIRPLTDGFGGTIVLQRMIRPMNTIRRITVLVPGPVIQNDAFENCMDVLSRISNAIGCATEFYGKDQPMDAVRGTGLVFSNGRVTYNEVSETDDMHLVIAGLHSDHLLVIAGPREHETHAGRAFLHLYERIHMQQGEGFSTMLLFAETDALKGKEEATVRTERDFLKLLRM